MLFNRAAFAVVVALLLSALARASSATDALETVRVQAYSESFAKRFALPPLAPGMQTQGYVHALEFSIERLRPSGYHWCVLKTYLDSTLQIDFPVAGRSGARSLVNQREHFMFDNNEDNKRWLSINLEDRLHFSREDQFGQRAALASPHVDWPKKGYWAGLTYDAFHQELFPGITYIKFGTPCGTYAAGKGKLSPQLLIERVGGKDYGQIVKPDPSDFLKLDLPSAFYEATLEFAERGRDRTREAIERGLKK